MKWPNTRNHTHFNITLSHAEIQMSDVQLDLNFHNGCPNEFGMSYYPRLIAVMFICHVINSLVVVNSNRPPPIVDLLTVLFLLKTSYETCREGDTPTFQMCVSSKLNVCFSSDWRTGINITQVVLTSLSPNISE